MRLRTAAFAALALALSGSAALAHDVIAGPGYLNGLLHPLLVPAHALCLLAFGLMAGQQNHHLILAWLFLVALLAGIAVVMFGTFPIDMIPVALLACAATAGLLTALGHPLPWGVPTAILAAGAVALIADSVPSIVSQDETIRALRGTAATAIVVMTLIAHAVSKLTRDWQRIGVRIVGSWTAASALLVLAQKFAR